MQILIFNWRDLRNPRAGGAEVLIHEMARRWVAQGHSVTLLTSTFVGAKAEEEVDGVRIVRCGGALSVYWKAWQMYRKRFRGRCDLVVDVVNTIPFFTPLYVQEPVVMHFNQLAREVWFYELPWFIGWLGFLMEPGWLMLYRNRPVVTISTSSRNDLIRLGFDPTRVTVIPMANRPYAPLSQVPKESAPTVLFVGRLKRSKRVHHAIHAFHRLRRHWPEARLWIVGDGDVNYRKALQRQVERLGLGDAVVFFGAVSEEEKVLRLAQAHLLCVPSVREGWGIVVSEAASQGTPAVVYPVAGLVDSVKDRKTGWICSSPTPRALADAMCELIGHPAHWERLQEGIRREPIVTWDDTASVYWQALRRAVSSDALGPLPSFSILLGSTQRWDEQVVGGLKEVGRILRAYPDQFKEVLLVAQEGDVPPLKAALEKQGISPNQIRVIPFDPYVGPLSLLWSALPYLQSEWVLLTDPNVDLPTGALVDLLKRCRFDVADLVVASRRHGKTRLSRPLFWRILAECYHRWVRWLFGVDMGDIQNGIRLIRAKVLEDVLPRLVFKEYVYDLELLAVAHRRGFRIAIEPITVKIHPPRRRAYWLDMFHLVVDTLGVWYRIRLRYYDRPLIEPRRLWTVSIVIPCKEPNPYLEECLRACFQIDYPKHLRQVVVMPDGPWPAHHPDCHVIATGPVGPAAKRDMALPYCTGEILAFIDDDTVPRRDWLKRAVHWFEDDRIAAVAGPAITPASDTIHQSASGAVYGSWLVSGNQVHRYIPQPERWVDDFPSCNLFVRKSVLEEVGGFDTSFWPGEDTLLCQKITHGLKRRIRYDPSVVVYHHRRPLFYGHLNQIRRYAQHRGYFARRCLPTSLRLRYFLPSLLVGWMVLGAVASLFLPSFRLLYGATLGIYFGLAGFWALSSLNLRKAGLVFLGIVLSHIVYGVAFLSGLCGRGMAKEA